MGRLDNFDESQQERIKAIARQLVEGKVARNEIPFTTEAIRAAMPDAFDVAIAGVVAADEYVGR